MGVSHPTAAVIDIIFAIINILVVHETVAAGIILEVRSSLLVNVTMI